MTDKLQIKTCPTCGSEKIQLVVCDVTRQYKGELYTVPELEYYECPNCGERIYGHKAMQKIREHSPAYHNANAMSDA